MQPSPYTPGEVARSVPGRSEQLRQLDERLAYLTQVRRLVGRVRVDYGPRGVGKTSLLREFQRRARQAGALTAWVTAGDVALATAITSELERQLADGDSDTGTQLSQMTHEFQAKVRLPGVAELGWTTTRGSADAPERPPAGVREFEAVIHQAAATALDDEQYSAVVLLIDEIQAADHQGLRILGYAMQHFQAEAPELPLGVFAVGLPQAPDVIGDAVTFSERFRYRPLGGLDDSAAAVALAGPARDLGVEWSPDALDIAVSAAGGYPYALQEYGSATWEAAGYPDRGHRLTIEHVRAAADEVTLSMETMFRARWGKATSAEQRILSAMAQLGAGPVRRSAVEGHVGINISDARATLIDKGLIQPAGHGQLGFTTPGFAAWVRGRTDSGNDVR